ncbi:transposase [Kineococcus sp. SYSU DK018]|uniref:transposase n=1 Tax=Kineococcus sp. SYSU DK018 TaxID=3383139 RepID=UPI003D7DB5D4
MTPIFPGATPDLRCPAYRGKPTGLASGDRARLLERCGGIRPHPRIRGRGRLSLAEREEISRGLAEGCSLRQIAHRLHRAPSTISREVTAGGGRCRYRAVKADERAWARAARPKPWRLVSHPQLCQGPGLSNPGLDRVQRWHRLLVRVHRGLSPPPGAPDAST